MPTEDRRVGKLLPDPVTPAGTVCFKINIPNAVQYRAAFLGQINVLGQALTWDHPTDGTECIDCEEAAQLWRNAIYAATWSDECDPMVDCEDVAGCIETSEAVQTAIQNISSNTVDNRVVVPATYPPGQPNPTPGVDLAAGTNPTCDKDILWAQCLAIAQQTNLAIVDVLQKIEVSTNAAELLDALSEVPLVGWAKEALGGQAALDLIQYYQEALEEQYVAQYTETPGGVQDQIACALFCECKADCVITIDKVFNVLKQRVEVYVTVPTLDTFEDLIDFAAGLSQDNTMVVDVAFFFAWGSIKLGSFFFGRAFDITLSMLLQLSINDANNDWEILCTECPDPDAGCAGGTLYNWITGEQGFEPFISRAIYHGGEGWGYNAAAASNRIGIMRNISPHATKIRVWTNEVVGAILIYSHTPGVSTTALGTTTYMGEDALGHMYELATVPSYTNYLMIEVQGSPVTATARIRRACINYD